MDFDSKPDLRCWNIFAHLDSTFVEKIRIACIFGNLGNETLVVTNDDQVYGMGSNSSGCLGYGDMVSTLLPRKVETLCKKSISGFAYGSGPHVLAYTANGDLFAWGHNGYYQLGNGTTNQGIAPIQVLGTLQGKEITEVACGSHHSLVITSDGELFSWGQNNCGQIGTGTTTNQPTPRKISTVFGGNKVIAITCGQTSSIAVLESGEVYGWGYNGNGQLGLGNNINQLNPCKVVALQGTIIRQVACGYAHTMALTDEGVLYTWGANSYGQLGTGNKSNSSSPVAVNESLGRVVSIGATHYNHISVAGTQGSKTAYVWGQCNGQSVVGPFQTPFGSLHEVFARFGTPSVTHKPVVITFNTVSGPTILDSIKLAFDDVNTADFKFVSDTREIHVHKSILKIRCNYFRSMFQEHWKENGLTQIEITPDYSFEVYKAFLKFIYTDEVELEPEDAISLLDLANAYCEPELKKRCEELIRQGISIENAAMLYSTAIKYQAKDLEEFCFRFSLSHMTAVTQTEAFSELDESTLKQFITKAAQNNAFRS